MAKQPMQPDLEPLHLSPPGGGAAVLTVRRHPRQESAVVEIPGDAPGEEAVCGISRRAGAALADWFTVFARPRPKLELWGVEGIAAKCKVTRSTVYNWSRRPDFPEPVPVVGGNGPVWEAAAVRAWVKLARPRGGRPRKQRARH